MINLNLHYTVVVLFNSRSLSMHSVKLVYVSPYLFRLVVGEEWEGEKKSRMGIISMWFIWDDPFQAH